MLVIKEDYINASEEYRFGSSEWFEPYTDNILKLFRSLQHEYGRCISKIYRDNPDGSIDSLGWVFQKTVLYEDALSKSETYVREVWVHVKYVKELPRRRTC